jgi:hypothetical protein
MLHISALIMHDSFVAKSHDSCLHIPDPAADHTAVRDADCAELRMRLNGSAITY